MQSILQDLRFGIRTIVKNSGIFFVTIVTAQQTSGLISKIGARACFALILILICYKPEPRAIPATTADFVTQARARFVLITSECLLGSGFLTGYQENGKAEVVTAYHLLRCEHGKVKYLSKAVRADGLMAEIQGADPQHDLLRLLVPLPVTAAKIPIRTKPVLGEPVFAIGSNPDGDRAVITWGSVFIMPPGEVTAKALVRRGSSGGQLISAIDGALLGMPVREEFGFTDAVSGSALLKFLEKARKHQAAI